MSELFVQEWNPKAKLVVIFIHAFPLSHAMWEGQIGVLQENYRVIAYDLRGFGKSPLGQVTMETFVDDLAEIMDEKKVEQVILCGLSMGGYVALRAAEKYPQRLKGLVLCNTRSGADDNAGKLKRAEAIRTIQKKGLETFAKAFVNSALSDFTKKENPDVARAMLQSILAQKPEGVIAAQLAMLSRTDTTEFLAKLPCFTLIVHGEDDGIIPLTQALEMQKKIPGSRMAVIPRAGHLSNLENSSEFNRQLLKFLLMQAAL